MPVVTLTFAPEADALLAPVGEALVEALGSAASSAGGVAVLDGGADVDVVDVVDDVEGVADVEDGGALVAWARAGAALRLSTATAAKARRLFIGMHAPICAPPRPATHNPRRR
jgi:hypothetical protein